MRASCSPCLRSYRHRAREVGTLDPDGGVRDWKRPHGEHELARRVKVVVVERDELAGVAVGLAEGSRTRGRWDGPT